MPKSPIVRDGGLMPQDWIENRNIGNANVVETYNKQIYDRYVLAVKNYNLSMDAGRDYPSPAPGVPQFYKLGPADSLGIQWPVLTDEVPYGMELPQLHEKAKSDADIRSRESFIHIGGPTPGGEGVWWNAEHDDTYPLGKNTPPGTKTKDGVVGVFRKVGSPVGNGWYEKVS